MKRFVSLYFVILSLSLSAQDYLGLEGSIPSNWSPQSELSMSSDHYKMGSESIRWDWNPGSQISISNPSGLAQACQTYKGGMILWIYNETPKEADLKFEFRNSGGTLQYYFSYHLNFIGWRACWVRFDEDMLGSKYDKNLTSVGIIAPSTSTGGRLFFDRMKFPSERINDRVTPDAQLDFINPDMNSNHWAALWHWHNTYEYELNLPASVNTEETAAFTEIRQRITSAIAGSAPSSSRISAIQREFSALNIQRSGSNIKGAAFVPADEYVYANGDKKFDDLNDLIYDIAKAWYHNEETGFDDMFCDLLDWLYDQGLTVGSGLGTNHHYGYGFRGFPKAIWLMQDVLKAKGKFVQAFEMIQYWTGVPEVRQLPQVDNFQGIVDAWNTIIPGRLMAIMLRDDSPELVRDMQSFTRWMDAVMQPSVGTMGGFKPDGSGFHHGMLYAGYMNGGYGGLGEVLNYVGNTHFNLSEEARNNFKKALFVHSGYANLRSLANSVCGRHPINQKLGTGAINAFAYLAKATDPIDEECAAEYMRLTEYKEDLYRELRNQRIRAASAPSGNVSLNYGALNLHRREDWLVATKGFNNIVTGTEIYTSNNRYGRYQSYGTIQILASSSPIDAANSGFVLEGWDWNRFPGATTIHLPYDLLNYSGGSLNERSKNSEFAGACSLDGNGVFGMLLDENDYTNYTDDFIARKSVFFFDNQIICLGSNINNSNSQYNTETTLFQTALNNTSESFLFEDQSISMFPYANNLEISEPVMLMDTKGNGYYLPSGTLHISKDTQESRDNKSKSVNYGDFATAWIDHGKAPVDANYEYAMLIQTNSTALSQFKNNMASSNKPYEVIRKDDVAHIVDHSGTSYTGYVVFKADNNISLALVKGSSYPCIIVAKDSGDGEVKVAFADPSINMEVPTKLTGTAPVEERMVRVTLNGAYQLKEPHEKCTVISVDNNTTVLEFTSIHGLPVEIDLVKDISLDVSTEDGEVRDLVNIYPNPVDNYLHYNNAIGAREVSIMSLDGKQVMMCKESSPIYVGNLMPGIYLIRIQFSDWEEVIRFVKS